MTDVIAGCASNIFAVLDFEGFVERLAKHHPEVVVNKLNSNDEGDQQVTLHTDYGNWPSVDEGEGEENFYQILADHAQNDLVVLNTVSIMGPGNIQFESSTLKFEEILPGVLQPSLQSVTLGDIERLQHFLTGL